MATYETGENDRIQKHAEGKVARAIEEQTAKVPSDWFLWAAGGSILGSLALQVMRRREEANFVGQWVPTLLILGMYNKMVKLLGHDKGDVKATIGSS